MSDFVKNIVKLARKYRASEQDALHQILQQSKENQAIKNAWAMVFFIRDIFENPNNSHDRKYTDPKYQIENQGRNQNQTHYINRLNTEIGKSIVRNQKSQKLLKAITNKLMQTISIDGQIKTVARFIDKSDLIQSFNGEETEIIEQILQTKTIPAGQHGNFDKNRANDIKENWNSDVEKLVVYTRNTKSFCNQLYHMLTSYQFEDAFIDEFKMQIIECLKQWRIPAKK